MTAEKKSNGGEIISAASSSETMVAIIKMPDGACYITMSKLDVAPTCLVPIGVVFELITETNKRFFCAEKN